MLKSANILIFKQRNGDANPEYVMTDLGKIYRGSGKGLVGGLGKGSGKGLVEVNINETKPNETSKYHSAAKAPVNKKKPVEEKKIYWKVFIEKFHDWYLKKFNTKYLFLKKDFAHMETMYVFFEKRSIEKKFEFTEENFLAAFEFFLNKAWEKDEWLRNNFTIPNLLSQFNQIANGYRKTGQKQATGGDVSMSGIAQKLAAMPNR